MRIAYLDDVDDAIVFVHFVARWISVLVHVMDGQTGTNSHQVVIPRAGGVHCRIATQADGGFTVSAACDRAERRAIHEGVHDIALVVGVEMVRLEYRVHSV